MLSRSEILEGLKACLPLDLHKLEETVANGELWEQWDPDGSGSVDIDEFMARDGLVAYMMEVFEKEGEGTPDPIPSIASNRLAWFEFFGACGGLYFRWIHLPRLHCVISNPRGTPHIPQTTTIRRHCHRRS